MTVEFEDRLHDELHTTMGSGPTPTGDWDDLAERGGQPSGAGAGSSWEPVSATVVLLAVAIAAVTARPVDHPVRIDSARTPPSRAPWRPETTVAPGPIVAVLTTTEMGTDQVSGLVATADGAWVALWGTGEVVRVDAAGGVTARVPIGTVQSGPLAIAAGEGSIWVLDFSTGDLVRIDPAKARITGRVHGLGEPERVAVGNGKVWVTACCDQGAPNQRLYRIDPTTLAIENRLALPGQGESEQVAVNAEGVWISGERFTTVVHVSIDGRAILGQTEVGDTSGSARNPCLVAAGTGAEVWCSVGSSGKVAVIGPSDHVTLLTPPAPVLGVTAYGDHLLVTTTDGLYLLSEGWVPWGGPKAAGLVDVSRSPNLDRVWVIQGSQLLQLQHP